MKLALLVAALAAAAPARVAGAVRMDERTTVTLPGALGKVARAFAGDALDGSTTTTLATADRRLTTSGDTGELVDLAEDRVYHLDLKAGTYTSATFEDLRRRFAAARRRAAATPAGPAAAPEEPRPATDPALELEVELRETGRTRAIHGLAAREVVLRVTAHERGRSIDDAGGLALTSEMWLARRSGPLALLADFELRHARRLAAALSGDASAGALPPAAVATHPMLKDVLVRWRGEGAKVDGAALLTTTKVELLASAEQRAEEQRRAAERERERARPQPARGGVGGMLGGLVAKAVERRVEKATEPAEDPGRATLVTMTSEVTALREGVAASEVALPAGLRPAR